MSWWIVIGFLILLVLGTLLTLYYLKPTEGFQQASSSTVGIYLVTNVDGTDMSYTEANTACTYFGARLALATEVYNAAVAGVDGTAWPKSGWIAEDQAVGYIPVKTGSSLDGVNGPMIGRRNAETTTNCNGAYNQIQAGGAAICYGILPVDTGIPSLNLNYKVTPTGGTNTRVDVYSMIDISGAESGALDSYRFPTYFDKEVLADVSGSYTILDLDALYLQKNIALLDIDAISYKVYQSEYQTIGGYSKASDVTGITQQSAADQRVQVGYVLATKHQNLLNGLTTYFSSLPYATDPYRPIVQAFVTAKQSNSSITFQQYINMLLNNINNYYTELSNKLKSHPVAYFNSGALNMPCYVNAFGLAYFYFGPSGDTNGWEYYYNDGIRKRRKPPYGGCGTKKYDYTPYQYGNTVTMHCPDGTWWQDKYDPNLAWDSCKPGWVKPSWNPVSCYQEWPQLDNVITARDVILKQIPSAQSIQLSYPKNFLSATEGWTPWNYSDTGTGNIRAYTDTNSYINKFKEAKQATFTKYGLPTTTNVVSTYRWKPVNYLGTLSAKNKLEAKKSAAISAIFNFTETSTIESQIRISSTPPFDLYFSMLGNAKSEFVQINSQSSVTPSSNAELLTALTILGVVISFAGGMVGVASALKGGAKSVTGTRLSRISNVAGLAGGAVSIGSAAAIGASAGKPYAANFTIAASNADYNASVCRPFNQKLFDLLPHHIRTFISSWAAMRKARMIDWFANSVFRPSTGSNKNPPEGPYAGSPNANAIAATWGSEGALNTALNNAMNIVEGSSKKYYDTFDVAYDQGVKDARKATSATQETIIVAIKNAIRSKSNDKNRTKNIIDTVLANPEVTTAIANLAALKAGPTSTLSSVENGVTIYDASGNFFGNGTIYVPREAKTINVLSVVRAKKVYDSMAQAYYTLNKGGAYITKIIDIYQVGETLFDVRFTESRKSGSQSFMNQIADLNAKYNRYRYMNLSENQLNNLEETYRSATEALYDKENNNLEDSAKDCGIKAQYLRISQTSDNGGTKKPFNFSQIIALNNYGQNVALFRHPVVGSINFPRNQLTYLASYENMTGKQYYDGNFNAYSSALSAQIANTDISGAVYQKLAYLTDGTYTKRYDSFYRSVSNIDDVYILINFEKEFDISVIKVLYNSSSDVVGGSFKIELLSKSKTAIANEVFVCNSSGSYTTTTFFKSRSPDLPDCPTDIYSQYKIGRFFATSETVTTADPPLTFGAYADGPDAATTFNPIYNGGFAVDTTNTYGNVNYTPITVFNLMPTTTNTVLPDCDNPDRIKRVFKDLLLNMNSSNFRNKLDIAGLTTLGTPYSENYIYKPAKVTKVLTESIGNNYSCAYEWKENVYDGEYGNILSATNSVGAATVLDDGKNTPLTTGQITRYGVLKHKIDDENWVSRGVVFDLSNSKQYVSRDILQANLGIASSRQLKTVDIPLYIPYFDSLTLDNKGGICPTTDCSNPTVINNIMTDYNKSPNVSPNDRVLRVTKAVTTGLDKCEYQYVTLNSANSAPLKRAFNVTIKLVGGAPLFNSDGTCQYVTKKVLPSNAAQVSDVEHISDSTPLLGRAYRYATDSIAPYLTRFNELFNDLSGTYIQPQVDPYGDGIKGDLIRYRTTTNTAAGQIRHVSEIDQPVKNELGVVCTTKCNTPEIIQSFFKYYDNTSNDRVTSIKNIGMDASGNCDFTYETVPLTVSNGTVTSGAGLTRGAKFKILRYLNSCKYDLSGSPAVIMPVPNFDSVKSVVTLNTFSGPGGTPVATVNSPITAAGVNSLDAAGNKAAIPITGPPPANTPLITDSAQSLLNQNIVPIENIHYVNCSSKYAIAKTGLSGTVTAAANVSGNPKKCQFKINGAQKEYSFVSQTGVVGVSAPLEVAPGSGIPGPSVLPADGPAVTIPTFASLTVTTDVICQNTGSLTEAQSGVLATSRSLTGFGSFIVFGKSVSNNTCEYKITPDNTLPFRRTFQTVSFYNDTAGLRLKSISNSNPATSNFAYFRNVTSNFINEYMTLLQFMRYEWNKQFYIKDPTKTNYWKMGKISKIGILADDDAIVFEAESSLYGTSGSLDIRDYSAKRYFKITPRIDTSSGNDPNNYTPGQVYPINQISIYKSEDSDTNFGDYRTIGSTITDAQYNTICTYKGINYNTQFYDLSGGTAIIRPTTAPPATYTVQPTNTALTYGYYKSVRFTVTESSSTTSERRAEITRFMFYDISGYGANKTFKYINIPNPIVELEDVMSNYPLVEKGKPTCDENFVQVIDPSTRIALCVYTGQGTAQYTQSTACNAGDTTVSITAGPTPTSPSQYVCVRPLTYTKVAGFACGIGYYGAINGTVCNLIGDFDDVMENPTFIFNTNKATPRLRLPLNKKLTIHFNKMVHIDGFSFITGSPGTLPLQWKLEGTVNGTIWRTIHCQNTSYPYSDAKPSKIVGTNTEITSFFSPGIFLINQKSSSGDSCATSSLPYSPQATTGPVNSGGYFEYNSSAYKNTNKNVEEGFRSTVPDSKKIQLLKFKILETYDPASKFVHMSQLDFITRSGRIHKSSIKLSNLQGSRNSPREGVTALLEGPQRRWVDYNKSEIIIQITGVSDPIIGFRFSIPQDVLSPMDAMPIEWVMYGSYNRQSWTVLHEFSGIQLPLVNSFATILFKFNEPVIV